MLWCRCRLKKCKSIRRRVSTNTYRNLDISRLMNRSYPMARLSLKLHGFNRVELIPSEALYIATEKGRRRRRVGIYRRHSRIGVGCGARTIRMGCSRRGIGTGGGGLQCRRWKTKPKKAQNIREYCRVRHQKSPEEGTQCHRDW